MMSGKEIKKDEFLKKYGEVEVTFSEYYKFSFSYRGKIGDIDLYVSFGGSAEDIYRDTVKNNESMKISQLDINYGTASKDGRIMETFYGF